MTMWTLVVADLGYHRGTPRGPCSPPAALKRQRGRHPRSSRRPGRWLLTLPPYHIAGIQVLVRSLRAGSTPIELDVSAGFDVTDYLLPLLDWAPGGGTHRWSPPSWPRRSPTGRPPPRSAELDAVLLGGGPAPRPVLDAAAAAGIAVVPHVWDERDRGRLRLRRRPVGRGPAAGARGRAHRDSGARRWPRATAIRSTPTRSPTPAGFAPTTWAPSTRAERSPCWAAPTTRSAQGGLTVLPQPVEAALGTHPAVGALRGLRRRRRPARAACGRGRRGA